MISILLRWKFCTWFFRDPIPERRSLSFELAGLVLGINPVEYSLLVTGLQKY